MIQNSKILAAIFAIGLLAASGCMTRKVSTVTPGPAGTFTTNTVTEVNTNNLILDCAAIQSLTATAATLAIQKDHAAAPILRDVHTALEGILNGANPGSVQDILNAAGYEQSNPAVESEIGPLVSLVSALEQSLLQKYGASVSGQISIAIAQAVCRGVKIGIANGGV